MTLLRSIAAFALLAAIGLLPARAAPVLELGVTASLFADAGDTHWFVNLADTGPAAGTGTVTQAISDHWLGGAQSAATSAYASLGALGGVAQASSTGTLLSGGQAGDDLGWTADLLITGSPGEKVTLRFASSLDGFVAGGATGPSSSWGGAVTSRTFVGGNLLADWNFSTLVDSDGFVFDEFATADYTFDVGSVVRVASRMTVMAQAEFEASVETNAINTSRFFVDVLTPGGGYQAAGDFRFAALPAAAVPEPPTPLLVAIAIVVLGRAGQRHARPLQARRRSAAGAVAS